MTSETIIQILQIVWIDLLLSGDNAVVIALACRGLPEDKRKIGIILGAGMAIALRMGLTVILSRLLDLPFIKLAGGLLLLLIAVKLVIDEEGEHEVASQTTIWGAVWTITLADVVMSLDNVLAIAGAARGHTGLIIFGLLLSIPLIVYGAGAVMKLMERFPILIWAGAALLGWIAGEMIVADPVIAAWVDRHGDPPDILASIAGAVLVIVIAFITKKMRGGDKPAPA